MAPEKVARTLTTTYINEDAYFTRRTVLNIKLLKIIKKDIKFTFENPVNFFLSKSCILLYDYEMYQE